MPTQTTRYSIGANRATPPRSKWRENGGGYTMESLLPWKDLAIEPKRGLGTALQVHINGADGDGPLFRAAWFPLMPASGRTLAMYRLRLARKPSAPVRAVARAQYDELARTVVRVVAADAWNGKTASVREKRRKRAEAVLAEKDGRARAEFRFPMPPMGETFGDLTLRVGRETAANVVLPDAQVWRGQKLMTYAPRFSPPVFAGTLFPACDYENPMLAERYLGPYRIETTFYDAKYNKVTAAEAPGRYGAIIDIVPDQGRALRRYATLFRQPTPFNVFSWWYLRPEATVALPPDLGIDHGSIAAQGTSVGTFMQWQFQDALSDDKDAAVVLAGLSETPKAAGARRVQRRVRAGSAMVGRAEAQAGRYGKPRIRMRSSARTRRKAIRHVLRNGRRRSEVQTGIDREGRRRVEIVGAKAKNPSPYVLFAMASFFRAKRLRRTVPRNKWPLIRRAGWPRSRKFCPVGG